MSNNARKAIGGSTKRLITRERGDVRSALRQQAVERDVAAALDEWRWDRSRIAATLTLAGVVVFDEDAQIEEYRRLVRENITPEAGD